MTLAITRHISSRFNECEITHIERTPINLNIARSQHEAYVHTLAEVGWGLLVGIFSQLTAAYVCY